jgi:hypothetical protein
VQETAPDTDFFPAEQAMHNLDDVAAIVVEYLLALHLVQELLPVADWYVPAEQLVQALAPDIEYLPAAQLRQVDEVDAPVELA